MNLMRAIIALVLVAAWVMGYDFYIHHHYLTNLYHSTASLWRPEDTMHSFMNFMWAGHGLFILAAVLMYVWGCKRSGIGEGIAFGVLLAAIIVSRVLIMYAVEPYTMELLKAWVATDCIEMLGVGILMGLVYKPKA